MPFANVNVSTKGAMADRRPSLSSQKTWYLACDFAIPGVTVRVIKAFINSGDYRQRFGQ